MQENETVKDAAFKQAGAVLAIGISGGISAAGMASALAAGQTGLALGLAGLGTGLALAAAPVVLVGAGVTVYAVVVDNQSLLNQSVAVGDIAASVSSPGQVALLPFSAAVDSANPFGMSKALGPLVDLGTSYGMAIKEMGSFAKASSSKSFGYDLAGFVAQSPWWSSDAKQFFDGQRQSESPTLDGDAKSKSTNLFRLDLGFMEEWGSDSLDERVNDRGVPYYLDPDPPDLLDRLGPGRGEGQDSGSGGTSDDVDSGDEEDEEGS